MSSTVQINNDGYIEEKKKNSTIQIENLGKKKKINTVQIKNTS